MRGGGRKHLGQYGRLFARTQRTENTKIAEAGLGWIPGNLECFKSIMLSCFKCRYIPEATIAKNSKSSLGSGGSAGIWLSVIDGFSIISMNLKMHGSRIGDLVRKFIFQLGEEGLELVVRKNCNSKLYFSEHLKFEVFHLTDIFDIGRIFAAWSTWIRFKVRTGGCE